MYAGAGFVRAIDAEKIGMAGIALGAGRLRKEDDIDPWAWIHLRKKVGERVHENEPVALFQGPRARDQEEISATLRGAFALGDLEPLDRPLIFEAIREDA